MSQTTKKIIPFFIVYDARSGSTFLANLLVKSAAVTIPPETNFITELIAYQGDRFQEPYESPLQVAEILFREKKFVDLGLSREVVVKTLAQLPDLRIGTIVQSILFQYNAGYDMASNHVGIKKGSCLPYYKQIKQLFPRAQFIGIIRDGRAVFSSTKRSIYSGTGKPFETNPFRAAERWCDMLDLLNALKQEFPEDTVLFKYEDIVTNADSVVQTIGRFLDLEKSEKKNDNMAKTSQAEYFVSSRYGTLHENINKIPLISRIDAWQKKLTSSEVVAFESVAGKHLSQEGYAMVNGNEKLKSYFGILCLRLRFLFRSLSWKVTPIPARWDNKG